MRRPWAVVLLWVLGIRYLSWRCLATLNLESPLAAGLSLTALTAEALLLLSGSLELLFSLWLPGPPAPAASGRPGGGADGLLQPGQDPGDSDWPWVDVLVPTYGEPLPLIEACLEACLDLDYPHVVVWLLDDSGRAELQRLCERLGVRYVARADRSHAKAGNLNHGWPLGNGSLIAVFDADVLPLRPFLKRTVPLFRDPRLGFVQTPQTYRNADPVMRNLRLERWLMPDEECFYRWIEPCRDAVGAVVCAGTSFVVRRQALERVGGFELGTPSEDLATGIRITAQGYRNRYLSDKLSSGLAPFSASAMARQRCRWAGGTVQVLRTGANPLSIPGLTAWQRLAYLEGILHWLLPLPQLLLALMPLSLAWLGIAPLRLSAEGLLTVALPFYAAQLLLIRWLSGQSRTGLMPELYRWIVLLPLAAAVLRTLMGQPPAFQVTPKDLTPKDLTPKDLTPNDITANDVTANDDRANDDRAGGRPGSRPPWRLLMPLLVLLALQLIGLVPLWQLDPGSPGAFLTPTTVLVLRLWTGLNALLLILAALACLERPGHSSTPWFQVPMRAQLLAAAQPLAVQLEAISEEGLELRLLGPPGLSERREPVDWRLELPPLSPTPLPITPLVWRGDRLGARWGACSPAQREALLRFLYRREGLWPDRLAPPEPLALLVVLTRLLRPRLRETWFQRSLIPQSPP